MFVPQVRSKLEILHDHGFPAYAFATMARYYGTHLKTIQDTVPPHKLLRCFAQAFFSGGPFQDHDRLPQVDPFSRPLQGKGR